MSIKNVKHCQTPHFVKHIIGFYASITKEYRNGIKKKNMGMRK